LGYVPKPNPETQALHYGRAFVVGTYVGYDDNKSMARQSIRISGAAGALPAWIETARGIERVQATADVLDVDNAPHRDRVLTLEVPAGLEYVPLDNARGLAAGPGTVVRPIDVPDASPATEATPAAGVGNTGSPAPATAAPPGAAPVPNAPSGAPPTAPKASAPIATNESAPATTAASTPSAADPTATPPSDDATDDVHRPAGLGVLRPPRADGDPRDVQPARLRAKDEAATPNGDGL
jgi:hypothetical protein